MLEHHWAQLDGALRADDFTNQEAVAGGVLDVAVAEPFLNGAGDVAAMGEREAAGMAQHSGRMDREGEGEACSRLRRRRARSSLPRTVCTLEPADVKMALG